jgi:hypothetical protein
MLNDHYLVSNSTNLANDLVNLRLNKNHKLIMHDIKDLCINIPIEETLDITKSLSMLKNNDLLITDQILSLMKSVFHKIISYFSIRYTNQKNGVAMGSPVPSTSVKTLLQYFKDKHIKHILNTKNVTFYICYVNDIVIIYDSKKDTF